MFPAFPIKTLHSFPSSCLLALFNVFQSLRLPLSATQIFQKTVEIINFHFNSFGKIMQLLVFTQMKDKWRQS